MGNQRANLTSAGREYLVGHDAAHHLAPQRSVIADAAFEPLFPRPADLHRLRPLGLSRAQHAGVDHAFARALKPAAYDVDRFDEMIGKVRMRCHAHPGACQCPAALGIPREHRGGAVQVGGVDPGAACHVFGCERRDRRPQRIEIGHVRRAERVILPAFGQNDVQHTCSDRDILTRIGLQENVGVLCGFRAARIYHDQLEAARAGSLHRLGRIRHIKIRAGQRKERVGAEHHSHIAVV